MGTKGKAGFTVDTKGYCFLCLKYYPERTRTSRLSIWKEGGNKSNLFPFHHLSTHLDLDVGGIISKLKTEKIILPVCNECSSLADQFTEVYKQFSEIKLRLESCVRNIQEVMVGADGDESSFKNYSKRLKKVKRGKYAELEVVKIVESLRERTMAKNLAIAVKEPQQIQNEPVPDSDEHGLDVFQPEPDEPAFETVTESQTEDESNIVEHTQEPLASTSITTEPTSAEPPTTEQLPDEDPNNGHDDDRISEVNADSDYDPNESLVASPPKKKRPSVEPLPPGQEVIFKKLGAGSYECNQCGKSLPHSFLVQHRRAHLGQKQTYPCTHCPSIFTNSKNVRTHLVTVHRESFFEKYKDPRLPAVKFNRMVNDMFDKIKYRKMENDLLRCPYCEKTSTNRATATEHLVRMHLERFTQIIVTLQANYFLENGESPVPDTPPTPAVVESVEKNQTTSHHCLKCLVCGNEATTKEDFDVHLNTHKKCRCPYCPAVLKDYDCLLYHTLKHHPSQIFSLCRTEGMSDLEFTAKLQYVIKSFIVVEPEKPGEDKMCQICSTTFRHLWDVETHLIDRHFEQVVNSFRTCTVVILTTEKAPPPPPIIARSSVSPTRVVSRGKGKGKRKLST